MVVSSERQQVRSGAARLRRAVFTGSVLLTWLAAACGSATPVPTPTLAAASTNVAVVETAVPTTVVPTPSAGKAVVTGYLKTNPSQPKPAAGLILYLADVLPEGQGTPFLASFDRIHSVRTQTDPNGEFVFADVNSSQYSLILDRVAEAYMLTDPQKPGADFLFTPQAGQVLNLGDLVYGVLPGSDAAP